MRAAAAATVSFCGAVAAASRHSLSFSPMRECGAYVLRVGQLGQIGGAYGSSAPSTTPSLASVAGGAIRLRVMQKYDPQFDT